MTGTNELSSSHVKTINDKITEFNEFLNKEEDCINRKYNEVKSVYQSEFEKWTVKKGEADSKLKEVIKLLPEFHDRNSQEIGTLLSRSYSTKGTIRTVKK